MTSKGRPTPWRQRRYWPALFLALSLGCPAAAQAPAALREVVAQLKQEANEARQTNIIPQRPDFASRFDGSLTPAELQAALMQRADRDPFIDAYVRWQLTSFKPELSWNQRDLLRLLRELPPLMENPRGDERLLDLLQQAVDAGPLARDDLTRLKEMSRELDERTALAEQLNRPAIELRHWLRDSLGDTGPQRLQAMIEHCAATIDGAWSTQGIKMRLTNALTASVGDVSLTNADRRMIAGQLHGLAGRHRRYVNVITFMANGTVNVTYSNARVTQRDVDAWVQRMAGTQ